MNAEVKLVKTAAEATLAEAFAAAKAKLPGGREVAQRREAAFKRFERTGLPHRRIEDWKYTDLRTLMRDAMPLATPPSAEAKHHAKAAGTIMAGVTAHHLVFVDGFFVPELSDLTLEPGVTVTPLAQALGTGDAGMAARFATAATVSGDDAALALNTAFMADGAVIRIAKDTVVAKPIHLLFTHTHDASTVFTRSQLVVEAGAQVMLAESHEGPDGVGYQINTAFDLTIGERAKVDHVKIAGEGDAALHVSTLVANVGKAARYNDFVFTIGGAVVRSQLFVTCTEQGAILNIAGANLLRGRQHADTTLVLDHAAAGCTSRELFKSVLDDESRGVFQGKIVVRPGAQKTDARMMTRALLLSEDAEADNKPELEIFADDVQCGHGATTGELDENLKFYLMARGIPESEAEALLVQAFIGEAVETIEHHGVRDALMFTTLRWLGQRP